MTNITVNYVKDDVEAILPVPATEFSAGLDLVSIENVRMMKGEIKLISTGLRIEIPVGYVGLIFPRSGLATKHGITLINNVGVIDSDYRGIVKVALVNHGPQAFEIEKGMRVAQLILMPYVLPKFFEVDELSVTGRGEGGFGHTKLK